MGGRQGVLRASPRGGEVPLFARLGSSPLGCLCCVLPTCALLLLRLTGCRWRFERGACVGLPLR